MEIRDLYQEESKDLVLSFLVLKQKRTPKYYTINFSSKGRTNLISG